MSKNKNPQIDPMTMYKRTGFDQGWLSPFSDMLTASKNNGTALSPVEPIKWWWKVGSNSFFDHQMAPEYNFDFIYSSTVFLKREHRV